MTRGSANSGKRSMTNTLTQAYSGASASQQVRAAEWAGQLEWNNAHHPPSASASSSMVPWQEPDVDYNMPWFEMKNGEWFCKLCSRFASGTHVTSTMHVTRANDPQWYGFEGLVGNNSAGAVVSPDYNHPWFELRQGDQFCLLCTSFATEGHITSEKHKKRAMWPESYGFPSSGAQARPLTMPAQTAAYPMMQPGMEPVRPLQYQAPYFEYREGEWFCILCNNWATEGHVTSGKHTKRAQNPEYYLPSLQAAPMHHVAAIPALANAPYSGEEPLPPPWEGHFSQEHHMTYYHNRTTGTTTWERPTAPPRAPSSAAELYAAQEQYAAASAAAAAATQAQHAAASAAAAAAAQQRQLQFSAAQQPQVRQAQQAQQATASAAAAAPAEAPWTDTAEWHRHWDPQHIMYYYHNVRTLETQWEAPEIIPAAAPAPPPPAPVAEAATTAATATDPDTEIVEV